jgi:glycosyltransferase involved in cell wall biosynthesis
VNLTNNKKPSITAFFPAYNDEASIGLLVERAFEVLSRYTDDCEVVVVNDGSSDRTAEVLDEMARRESRLRVIHHAVNQGYGGALRTGFQYATKDLVFYTDGDGQYDVEEISRLLPLMTERIDVVNGYKIKRSDHRRRIVLGKIYQFLAWQLFNLPIRDVDCDFRLMRRNAIQRIHLVSTSGVVCTEMIYKLRRSGCRFTETPVHHYPRLHGQSQFFTLSRVARTAYDFFLLWINLVVLGQGRAGTEISHATVGRVRERESG